MNINHCDFKLFGFCHFMHTCECYFVEDVFLLVDHYQTTMQEKNAIPKGIYG